MAETLYNNALNLMEEGRNEEACPLLEQSQKIDPAVGTLLYLGLCYERTGRTASAWVTYRAAGEAGRRGNQVERSRIALENAARLEPELTRLTIVMPESSPDATFSLDGAPLGSVAVGMAMPVDPGEHVIEVQAPGMRPVEMRVEVKAGERDHTVSIPRLQPLSGHPKANAQPIDSGVGDPNASVAGDASANRTRLGLGVVVGADIDGKFRGAVATVGITYGATDWLDLQLNALVGRDRGAEPGASFYLLDGVVRPMLHVGVPVFMTDGVRPGAHGSAGLRVNPAEAFGLYARGGLTAFASAPEGYDETVPVLSAGAMGQF